MSLIFRFKNLNLYDGIWLFHDHEIILTTYIYVKGIMHCGFTHYQPTKLTLNFSSADVKGEMNRFLFSKKLADYRHCRKLQRFPDGCWEKHLENTENTSHSSIAAFWSSLPVKNDFSFLQFTIGLKIFNRWIFDMIWRKMERLC